MISMSGNKFLAISLPNRFLCFIAKVEVNLISYTSDITTLIQKLFINYLV